MIKKLSIVCLALLVGVTIFGCAKVSEQTQNTGTDVTGVTGTPPAGTTQVKLSAGNVVASSNALSFALTALNQSNSPLTGMGGGNFTGKIYSGNPTISSITASTTLTAVATITVTAATFGGAGVSAVTVIDKSGSMGFDDGTYTKVHTAEAAGKLFVDQMATGSNNKMAVVLFDTHVSVEASMMNASANKQTLYDAVTKEAGYGTRTALYYAIANGIWEASKEVASASRVRAVVALTDGLENESPSPYNGVSTGTVEVINQALKYSVPVYTIGLFSDTPEANTNSPGLKSIAKETTGSIDNYFEVIIGVTGLSVSAERVRALGLLTDLYQKLSQALTQSYTFTCSLSTTLSPGTYWLLLTLQNYGTFSGQTVVAQFTVI